MPCGISHRSGPVKLFCGNEDYMNGAKRVEKFDSEALGSLREVLTQFDLDSFQASELLSAFLNGRGYGADARLVQDAVLRMEGGQCDADCMQAQLERVALVM